MKPCETEKELIDDALKTAYDVLNISCRLIANSDEVEGIWQKLDAYRNLILKRTGEDVLK